MGQRTYSQNSIAKSSSKCSRQTETTRRFPELRTINQDTLGLELDRSEHSAKRLFPSREINDLLVIAHSAWYSPVNVPSKLHNFSFEMRIVQSILLCFVLAVSVIVMGCDSSNSNPGEPFWIGKWEVTSVEGGELQQGAFWSITSEQLLIKEIENIQNEPNTCGVDRELSVTNVDGNTVDFSSDDGEVVLEFEGSKDEMNATVLESFNSDEVGAEATAQAVSELPDICQ